MCHIVGSEEQRALVVSLTQVRVSPSMPLAAAVADYQKHRVKKLKSKVGPKSSSLAEPLSTHSVEHSVAAGSLPRSSAILGLRRRSLL